MERRRQHINEKFIGKIYSRQIAKMIAENSKPYLDDESVLLPPQNAAMKLAIEYVSDWLILHKMDLTIETGLVETRNLVGKSRHQDGYVERNLELELGQPIVPQLKKIRKENYVPETEEDETEIRKQKKQKKVDVLLQSSDDSEISDGSVVDDAIQLRDEVFEETKKKHRHRYKHGSAFASKKPNLMDMADQIAEQIEKRIGVKKDDTFSTASEESGASNVWDPRYGLDKDKRVELNDKKKRAIKKMEDKRREKEMREDDKRRKDRNSSYRESGTYGYSTYGDSSYTYNTRRSGHHHGRRSEPTYTTGYSTGYSGKDSTYTTGYSTGYSTDYSTNAPTYTTGYSTGYSGKDSTYTTGYSTDYSTNAPTYTTGYSTNAPTYTTGYTDKYSTNAPTYTTGYTDKYSTGYSGTNDYKSYGDEYSYATGKNERPASVVSDKKRKQGGGVMPKVPINMTATSYKTGTSYRTGYSYQTGSTYIDTNQGYSEYTGTTGASRSRRGGEPSYASYGDSYTSYDNSYTRNGNGQSEYTDYSRTRRDDSYIATSDIERDESTINVGAPEFHHRFKKDESGSGSAIYRAPPTEGKRDSYIPRPERASNSGRDYLSRVQNSGLMVHQDNVVTEQNIYM